MPPASSSIPDTSRRSITAMRWTQTTANRVCIEAISPCIASRGALTLYYATVKCMQRWWHHLLICSFRSNLFELLATKRIHEIDEISIKTLFQKFLFSAFPFFSPCSFIVSRIISIVSWERTRAPSCVYTFANVVSRNFFFSSFFLLVDCVQFLFVRLCTLFIFSLAMWILSIFWHC